MFSIEVKIVKAKDIYFLRNLNKENESKQKHLFYIE
jgi:hypothetical protein